MRTIYSFVVDGGVQFLIQTRIFLSTLTAVGVSPGQIVAHHTPKVWAETLALAKAFGIITRPLEPFLDGKYCNKLNQLPALLELDADAYALCDTDLAFVTSIDSMFSLEHARARLVGVANPPLPVLSSLLASRGITARPRIVRTTLDGQSTWSVNCNGGLYLLPRFMLQRLASLWRQETEFCYSLEHLLGPWRKNADQLGFALAMLSDGNDVLELPVDANLPLLAADRLRHLAISHPAVLHYHTNVSASGKLLRTGHPIVDEAVDKINVLLM